MRTTGKGGHYCAHCGYDCTPIKGEPGVAHEMCPSRDGDFCEPKKRVKRVRQGGGR
jgi:putative hemolysin